MAWLRSAGGRWGTAGVLAACALAVFLHQQVLNTWWIEDAAISFAYARNLANGDGLVPWPGGERVEGYSNPTWVALLAVAYALGVEGFTASKVLGTVFAILALWPTWRLARYAVHPDDRPADRLAPVLLAGSAQFAIWSASGLENALFGFLLVGGAARLVREAESPRFPASALWFLTLAWTRPEGVAFAAVAFAWVVFAAVRDRRFSATVPGWVALFAGPCIVLFGLRLWYFAWPLPNTYYAKLGDQGSGLWEWHGRGWQQLKAFAGFETTQPDLPGGTGLSQGFFVPVYLAGLLGLRGWRRFAWGVAVAAVVVALLVPGPYWLHDTGLWPAARPMRGWLVLRIAGLYALLVLAPFAALGASGLGLHRLGETRWFARGLVFHLLGAAVVFGVYSTGDWMRGFRWMSLFAPTAAVLLAVGIGELASAADRLARRCGLPGAAAGFGPAGIATGSLLLGTSLAVNVVHTAHFARDPEWPPALIKLRVDYTQRLADAVYYDEPVVPLDMDMGAHLWFSRQRPIDMGRLVDVPMAQHRFRDRAFIEEYVFDENRPDFAHVHGAWGRDSAFTTYDAWSDYFLTPGYRDRLERDGVHGGVWMRRSLMMGPEWSGPSGREVAFERGITVRGWDVPSPEVATGGRLYLELGLSQADPVDTWAAVVFLSGRGGMRSWDLPLGHGVLPPSKWRKDEVFHGRWSVSLGDLPAGAYTLGLALLDRAGGVLLPIDAAQAAERPQFAVGELPLPGRVLLVTPAGAEAYAQRDVGEVHLSVAAGDCAAAEASWVLARRHLPNRRAWADDHDPSTALAECWARFAERARGTERVEALARAHRWDPRAAEFLRVSEGVGARLWLAGLSARDRRDWEASYAAFRDLLRFQPWRSWARRYAEEARDHRLGITD